MNWHWTLPIFLFPSGDLLLPLLLLFGILAHLLVPPLRSLNPLVAIPALLSSPLPRARKLKSRFSLWTVALALLLLSLIALNVGCDWPQGWELQTFRQRPGSIEPGLLGVGQRLLLRRGLAAQTDLLLAACQTGIGQWCGVRVSGHLGSSRPRGDSLQLWVLINYLPRLCFRDRGCSLLGRSQLHVPYVL